MESFGAVAAPGRAMCVDWLLVGPSVPTAATVEGPTSVPSGERFDTPNGSEFRVPSVVAAIGVEGPTVAELAAPAGSSTCRRSQETAGEASWPAGALVRSPVSGV